MVLEGVKSGSAMSRVGVARGEGDCVCFVDASGAT